MEDEEPFACQTCGKSCKGSALRVQDFYFHAVCFVCKVCTKALASGGFFAKDDDFYCIDDYHALFGTKCAACSDYVEGDVVTAAGQTFHKLCFACGKCKTPFMDDEKVIFDGKFCVCSKCSRSSRSPTPVGKTCGGCGEDLDSDKVLIALNKSWHVWCFKCHNCQCLLAGEYMGRDGYPYCEKDYHTLFGVKCAGCGEFITGKVLQVGEESFHPTCARCAHCGLDFGEGEEMFIKNSEVWHPNCDQAKERVKRSSDMMNGLIGGDGPAVSNSPSLLSPSAATRTGSRLGGLSGLSISSDPFSGSDTEETTSKLKKISIDSNQGPKKSFLSFALEEAEKALQSPPEERLAVPIYVQQPDIDPVSLARSPSASQASRPGGASPTRPRSATNPGRTSPGLRLRGQKSVDSAEGPPSRPQSSASTSSDTGVTSPVGHQPSGIPIYSLEALQGHGAYKLPRGVDRTRLEMYLSDFDFRKVFNMTREEFGRLAVWRQRELKKRARLF
ncbi:actin-binding LIM protein 2-like [Oscarella lobularis]|uniref:actin-binding LIM protein 2-like n=1 Tax=Oscarella lobularis TaxID=121494 RepID=UPI003314280A